VEADARAILEAEMASRADAEMKEVDWGAEVGRGDVWGDCDGGCCSRRSRTREQSLL
jgi:hypothetical protein